MTRLDKGIYLHHGKKLNLKVINGKLLVRMGGGYQSFETYAKNLKQNKDKKARSVTPNQPPKRID